MHLFYLGILLGLGAAIPVGPVNIEITRRNLRFGSRFGLFTGFGACSADVIYLVLISFGALTLLQHSLLLKIVGVIGGLILGYFGVSALRLKAARKNDATPVPSSLVKNYLEGLFMTLVNPVTIIFWASVSSHIVISAGRDGCDVMLAGLGVIIGTVSWVCFLNSLLHKTKHRLSEKSVHRINIAGGLILLGFAALSLFEALA